MDFLGKKCPVCEKYFHADEDIVVCPECGTPHHRECYESVGHCHNEALHGKDYDYAADDENGSGSVDSDVNYCTRCGKPNDKDAFFCKYCAAPLAREEQNAAGSNFNGSARTNPFGGFAGMPNVDPMGGVDSAQDMGDGVTAGELAKYVKQNTPYFMRVFENIRTINRTRFSFVGLFFGGGYLLYRKMYKLGTLMTILQAALMITSICLQLISPDTTASTGQSQSSSGYNSYFSIFSAYSNLSFLYDILPMILNLLFWGIGIATALSFNRLYFKHCKQQVINIKSSVQEGENAETVLQTKGGVNMPLAYSLLITYALMRLVPTIILMMS